MERAEQIHIDSLSRNIVQLRAEKALTQEQLAEKAEITPRYLQGIEAGSFGGSLAVLIRLRRALGCSWNRLFTGIE